MDISNFGSSVITGTVTEARATPVGLEEIMLAIQTAMPFRLALILIKAAEVEAAKPADEIRDEKAAARHTECVCCPSYLAPASSLWTSSANYDRTRKRNQRGTYRSRSEAGRP